MNMDGSNRPVVHYRFHCVHRDEGPIEGKILPTFVPDREMMIDNDRQKIFMDSKIDDLICTSLFSALHFKAPRKPLEAPIEVTINWFETPVRVITRSETGKTIASVSDLRYFIAIMGICYELVQDALRQDRVPDNSFAIDMQDIHDMMGRKNEGGNIDVGLNAMKRLASTTFEIPHLPKNILERFDSRLDDGFMKINPLHDFSCYWTDKSKVHKKTIVTFGLPIVVFKSMVLEKFLFKVNPRLYGEDNDVIIGFHLWCRRRIGLKAKTITTSLRKLHLDVAPTLKYKEFLDRFYGGLTSVYESNIQRLPTRVVSEFKKEQSLEHIDPKDEQIELSEEKIKNHQVVHTCNIDVYGYRVHRSKTDDLIIFQNPNDPYVGLRSNHSYAVTRRNQEILDDLKNHPGARSKEEEEEYEKMVQDTLFNE